MAAKKPKTITDEHGNNVPLKFIPEFDRDCDALAKALLERFLKERERLETLAADTLARLEALSEKYLARTDGRSKAPKGNYAIMSFDNKIRISMRNIQRVQFDARIQRARDLINEMIRAKSGGIDEDIMELINNAFTPRADGMLSNGRVFGLLRLSIKDPRWKEAMAIIRDAIKVTSSRPLVYVEQRQPDGTFKSVKLDLAECFTIQE